MTLPVLLAINLSMQPENVHWSRETPMASKTSMEKCFHQSGDASKATEKMLKHNKLRVSQCNGDNNFYLNVRAKKPQFWPKHLQKCLLKHSTKNSGKRKHNAATEVKQLHDVFCFKPLSQCKPIEWKAENRSCGFTFLNKRERQQWNSGKDIVRWQQSEVLNKWMSQKCLALKWQWCWLHCKQSLMQKKIDFVVLNMSNAFLWGDQNKKLKSHHETDTNASEK